MRLIVKSVLLVLLLLLPAVVAYANDKTQNIASAPQSNDAANVELSNAAPMKFSQQIVTGNSPEWLRLAPAYAAQSPLPVRGQAMYYNPGVMQKVLAYRHQLRQIENCEDCIGYVALLRAGDINRKVWLQVSEDTVEGPFLVTDVAARHDIPRLLRIGWGIDVDWETAKRWNLRMPMVTIHDAPPVNMIVNSTAQWRDALKSTARQFNEIAAWNAVAPAGHEIELIPVKETLLDVDILAQADIQAQPATAQSPAVHDGKGVVVNNIFFKQGEVKIQMERQK